MVIVRSWSGWLRRRSVTAAWRSGRGSCCWPPRGWRTRGSRSGSGASATTVIAVAEPLPGRGVWPGWRIAPRSGRPRELDHRGDRDRDAEAAAEEAGRDALVEPAAGRPAEDQQHHGGPGVAGLRDQAVEGGVVPVLHRPRAGREGHRHLRALPGARRRTRSCCAWTRSPRSRRWTAPCRSCRCSQGRIERRSHDYYRHGTTTLFAALDIATGQVTAALKPRHRHQEFLAFLKQIERTYRDVLDEARRAGRAAPGDGQLRRPQAHRTSARGWPRTPGSSCTSPRPTPPG